MVVLNGYRDGLTYVTDPSYAYKSSNESVSSLWANQSYDVVDRELGYVFYEITGGGFVPEPEPEPEDEHIFLEELKGLTKEQASQYLAQYGIKPIFVETVIETNDASLENTSSIQTSTKGIKHYLKNKTIELNVNVYKYVEEQEETEE